MAVEPRSGHPRNCFPVFGRFGLERFGGRTGLELNGVDTIYGVAGIPITDLLRSPQPEGPLLRLAS
jgi:hypothetical protein